MKIELPLILEVLVGVYLAAAAFFYATTGAYNLYQLIRPDPPEVEIETADDDEEDDDSGYWKRV